MPSHWPCSMSSSTPAHLWHLIVASEVPRPPSPNHDHHCNVPGPGDCGSDSRSLPATSPDLHTELPGPASRISQQIYAPGNLSRESHSAALEGHLGRATDDSLENKVLSRSCIHDLPSVLKLFLIIKPRLQISSSLEIDPQLGLWSPGSQQWGKRSTVLFFLGVPGTPAPAFAQLFQCCGGWGGAAGTGGSGRVFLTGAGVS